MHLADWPVNFVNFSFPILKSNQSVKVKSKDNIDETAKIVGLNEYGYLRVQKSDQSELIVQPDGNRFDYMENLIALG